MVFDFPENGIFNRIIQRYGTARRVAGIRDHFLPGDGILYSQIVRDGIERIILAIGIHRQISLIKDNLQLAVRDFRHDFACAGFREFVITVSAKYLTVLCFPVRIGVRIPVQISAIISIVENNLSVLVKGVIRHAGECDEELPRRQLIVIHHVHYFCAMGFVHLRFRDINLHTRLRAKGLSVKNDIGIIGMGQNIGICLGGLQPVLIQNSLELNTDLTLCPCTAKSLYLLIIDSLVECDCHMFLSRSIRVGRNLITFAKGQLRCNRDGTILVIINSRRRAIPVGWQRIIDYSAVQAGCRYIKINFPADSLFVTGHILA